MAKRGIAVALFLLTALLLCACAEAPAEESFDPAVFVQNELDAMNADGHAYAEDFCEMLYLDASEESMNTLAAVFSERLAELRFELGAVSRKAVGVTVYPTDLLRNSFDELDMYDRDFTDRFAAGEFADMSGSEARQVYISGMADILRSAETTELEPVTITLHLSKTDDVWSIDVEELAAFREIVLNGGGTA